MTPSELPESQREPRQAPVSTASVAKLRRRAMQLGRALRRRGRGAAARLVRLARQRPRLGLAAAGGLVALVLVGSWLASRPHGTSSAPQADAPPPTEPARTAPAAAAAKAAAPVRLRGPHVLAGSVEDDRGQPLAGAQVRVSSLSQPESLPWKTTSDADGSFRVDELPEHVLALEVTREGHDGVERTVRAADAAALRFVLPRQGELSVVVRDVPGSTVEGASVFLTGPGLWPAAQARADASGEALFTGLLAGHYEVRVRHGSRIAETPAPVPVVPGQRAQRELLLEAGGGFRGQVIDRQHRRPLEQAQVSVDPLTPGIPPIVVRSDAEGQVSLGGLWSPTVSITVSHPGYAPYTAQVSLPQDGALVLELDGAAVLPGVVRDEAGQPLAGASVRIAAPDGSPMARATGADPSHDGTGGLGVTEGPVPAIPLATTGAAALGSPVARTDDRGRFRIAGLAPTATRITAARPGYVMASLTVEDLVPHAEHAAIELVLQQAGRIEGEVRDARGQPVAGAHVTARSTAASRSTLADEQGQFAFDDLLGEVTVSAHAPGFAPVPCRVQVAAGAVARCALSLSGALFSLAVRVLDDYGAAVDGALVTLHPLGRALSPVSLMTRADGSARFPELPEPPYAVSVMRRGFLRVEHEPVREADQELRIALAPAAALAGTVSDLSGRPVAGATVTTAGGEDTTVSDAHGDFLLDQVAPGVLTLHAHHTGTGQGQSRQVRARAGETLQGVRIVLEGRYDPRSPQPEPPVEGAKPEPPRDQPVPQPQSSQRASGELPSGPEPLSLRLHGDALVVSAVAAAGPAAQAGLQPGDRILAIDGETPLSPAHARGMLRDPAGQMARVRVRRGSEALTLRYPRPRL